MVKFFSLNQKLKLDRATRSWVFKEADLSLGATPSTSPQIISNFEYSSSPNNNNNNQLLLLPLNTHTLEQIDVDTSTSRKTMKIRSNKFFYSKK